MRGKGRDLSSPLLVSCVNPLQKRARAQDPALAQEELTGTPSSGEKGRSMKPQELLGLRG